jgi:putative heme-binding domain-containing protein
LKTFITGIVLALGVGGASTALAQHATASDIEDGGRAFENNCAACHGPDGNLIAGIDFRRGVLRRPLTDAEIKDIILHGIPNTPMPAIPGMSEEQAERIVAYLRSLPDTLSATAVPGDAERGRAIVSAQCLDCHRIGTQGSRLGPDLSRIGLERRATELERSLLDPAAEVQPAHRSFSVTPRRGASVTGRLLNQDTYTIQLIDSDERLRSFQKSDLSDYGFLPSPMPSYRDALDEQALADVVSYLVSLRGALQP